MKFSRPRCCVAALIVRFFTFDLPTSHELQACCCAILPHADFLLMPFGKVKVIFRASGQLYDAQTMQTKQRYIFLNAVTMTIHFTHLPFFRWGSEYSGAEWGKASLGRILS